MSHTISKDELRRPDQLTAAAQRFFSRLLKNQKLVLGVLGAVLALGLAFVGWEKTSLDKELALQEQYYSIEKTYLKKKEGFDKAEADKKDQAAKKDDNKDEVKSEPVGEVASGELSKDYGIEVEGWTKLIESRPSSKAAAMASLELSQLYLKYKKDTEAMQILEKVKNQQNSDSLLGALVFHAYANLLSNKDRCQDAIGIWENLEKKKKMVFLVEQAQMGKALCLETLGQIEKAELVLKDLAAGKTATEKQGQPKPKTQVQRSAEKFLRYLQVTKGMNAQKPS